MVKILDRVHGRRYMLYGNDPPCPGNSASAKMPRDRMVSAVVPADLAADLLADPQTT